MSAVSSESPRAAANLSEPSSSPSVTGITAATRRSAPPGSPGSDDSVDAGISGPGRADFGANEWMVDELYQRYLADPGSVDRAWWSFFADYRPTRSNGTGPHPAIQDGGPSESLTAPAPTTGTGTGAANAANGNSATVARDTQAHQVKPDGKSAPSAPATPPPADADLNKLRGAAARTAQNMAASLAVPTATSVRAVPAKLLIDNRIVINNHLHRGKGGKVSFTHLIGFAVVQAVKQLPEMNASWPSRTTSISAWLSTSSKRTAFASSWCRTSRARARWTSASSGPRTKT